MSQTELHIGKIRIVERESHETIDDVKRRIFESDENTEPYDSDSWDFNDYREMYVESCGELYEIIKDDERDAEDSYCELHKNEDGTINFSCQFYNGGTCLNEMLEDAISEFVNN